MGSLTLLASYYVWPVGRPGGDLRKEELGYLFTQLPPCHLLLAESLGLRSLCSLCCAVLSRSVVSNFLWPPQGLSMGLLCLWGYSRQEYWNGLPCPAAGDLSNQGIEPRSPTLQADSLPFEPPGKPKDTGVGSLSLLQGNFLTQKMNWGLLHCRRVLCQLSYQFIRRHIISVSPPSSDFSVF